MTLPASASARTRLRSINVEATSRPEHGSSRTTIAGSCSSAAAISTFCRMPFENDDSGA